MMPQFLAKVKTEVPRGGVHGAISFFDAVTGFLVLAGVAAGTAVLIRSGQPFCRKTNIHEST
jgi:hypothetical protein